MKVMSGLTIRNQAGTVFNTSHNVIGAPPQCQNE
jgi:hypothetical protein